ncbi:MAG: metal dependent phosphohydrolase [Gemmatimonadetes bacterium]|nr:metal dependent phosphohydrolase [Gemmatimonadota bacterium]
MFSGRVLIVSGRSEVRAVVDPIVRGQGHIALSVDTPAEALATLQQGLIPDVVVSDMVGPGRGSPDYVSLFQQSNYVGRHLALVEKEEGGRRLGAPRRTVVVRAPFTEETLGTELRTAMADIHRDLSALRGEVFRETARLQQIVRETQREVVEALALTIESRDPYMRGHCTRVAAFAGTVAQELAVADDDIQRLCTAARLHEIGRLSVPMELAHKVEPLTAAELDQVRAHTLTGAGIIRSIPSLRDVAVLVEGHAMPFADLTTVIPASSPDFVLAGILRVVDAFDAMTSPRAYRPSLSRSYWQSVLERGAGSQFDPRAVRAFLHAPPRLAAA